jgi:DNA-binding XRE family transcriptional regulator
MTSPTNIKLRALIAELGLTQAEVARKIGISERQMRAYLADPEVRTAIKAPPYVILAIERLVELERG